MSTRTSAKNNDENAGVSENINVNENNKRNEKEKT
jgi:hypothetical protein